MHHPKDVEHIQDGVMNLDAQVRAVLARADAVVAHNQPAPRAVTTKTVPVVTLQRVRSFDRRASERRIGGRRLVDAFLSLFI